MLFLLKKGFQECDKRERRIAPACALASAQAKAAAEIELWSSFYWAYCRTISPNLQDDLLSRELLSVSNNEGITRTNILLFFSRVKGKW